MPTWTGPLVKNLRLRLGWSKSELGRRLGMNLEQVTRLEEGEVSLDVDVINQLSHLKSLVDEYSDQIRNIPQTEKTMKKLKRSQLNKSEIDS